MQRVDAGFDWPRVLAMDEMVNTLKRAGWGGDDFKSFIDLVKHDAKGRRALEEFAGGELQRLKGTPLYLSMLEATALRYAMHTSHLTGREVTPPECPHGYRMESCWTCQREGR